MLRTGRHDPTTRLARGELWKASRTPDGPGTVHLSYRQPAVTATGYGPGAGWLLERADALAGLRDDPAGFLPLARQHPVVAVLADGMPGLRLARTERVFDELVRVVLAQKVTTIEATRSYAALVRRFGEPAPGPVPLLLPPAAETIAAAPYWMFHPLGIEQRRADTLRRLAAVADRLECTVHEPPDQARRLLMTRPGVGPWTAAEVAAVAYGDPDAVSVGDYHVPHQVAYALAGEQRGTDQRMLELLAPFGGHRARVIRLVVHAGVQEPRRAPRAALRSFARF
ncbi:DNA-3-methyladenine glycosylase 2 family protein [Actinocatenispora sera]|uniref:DNA-3-methyladenine glycosylase II n=1 Tax=Actinocatenispora sera TaxID=390989 RepID=A0A810L6I6_9ACTN|nr:DNA-3-methyladenine glycosylase 2 family protein [Actinocatenispora sera]BCJ30729.1 3-methyladenine DNA glycosylase [Actinocatenispora sera]